MSAPLQPDNETPEEAALRAQAPDHTRITVRMPSPVYDEVCRVAQARGITCSAVFRAAVTLFLRRLGPHV